MTAAPSCPCRTISRQLRSCRQDAAPPLSLLRVHADGRAAALPGGKRLRHLSAYIASGGDPDFTRPSDREFACTVGAEDALGWAREHGRTIVSMKEDWAAVFTGSG
jgi:hypothetical protein